MTLVKLLLGTVAAIAFVWFGANVELGGRTLFEHLQRIGQSREARDLADGARERGAPLVEEAKARLVRDGGAPAEPRKSKLLEKSAPEGGEKPADDDGKLAQKADRAPLEDTSDSDRDQLKKLIHERTDAEAAARRDKR